MALTPEKTVKGAVTDFLSAAPTLDEIIDYRLPDALEARAHLLLDKNREQTLTPEEQQEMEEFRQIDHLLTLIKAKARLRQRKQGS